MNFFSKLKKLPSFFIIIFLYHIIVITAGSLIYYTAISNASIKAAKEFDETLIQVENYVDSELKNADKIFSQVALLNNIQSLYTATGNTMSKHQLFYTYKLLIPNLKNCVASNNLIDNIFIYFPGSNYIVSGAGTFDRITIDYWFKSMIGFDKEGMIEIISSDNNALYIPITDITKFSHRRDLIAYMRPIQTANSRLLNAVIIIFIKQSEILNSTNKLFYNINGDISVITKSSNFIFNEAPDYLINKQYSYFTKRPKPKKIFTITNGRSQYIANNISSDIADWDYILSLPKNTYYANMNNINNIMLISIIVYLISSYVFGYYLYQKNYVPIQRMVSVCSTIKKIPSRVQNKFRFIEESVNYIVQENRVINNILEGQKENMKDEMLNQLITISDNYSVKLNTNKMPSLGLYFDKTYFFIIIIYLNYNKTSDFSEKSIFENNYIHEQVTHGFKNVDNLYFIKSKNKVICVSNTDVELNYVVKRAKEICNEIIQKADIGLNNNFSFAASAVHYDINNLPDAYTEALTVMEYKIYMDNPNVLFFEEIKNSPNNEVFYTNSMGIKLKILNQIKSHEYAYAKDLINKHIDDIIHSYHPIPLPLIKCQMYEFINLSLSTVDEVRKMYGTDFMKEVNITRILLDCHKIAQLQKCVAWIFDQAKIYVLEKEKELEVNEIHKLVSFIKDNFSNPDMSLKYLSQVFNKDESYISSNFKKYAGMGYLDYLHSARIREAKRLMLDKSLKVKDIAYMVGYANDLMLIRVFRRYEGVTPTQSRNLNYKCGVVG